MPWIELHYPTKCAECRYPLEEGERAYFNGKVFCEECGKTAEEEDNE